MKRTFLAMLIALASAGHAAAYPDRPITIVVGFPAGSSPDIAARLVGQKLSERLHVPTVVENRPGAAGTIGTALVARAAPDGYTLLLGSASSLTVGPALYKNVPYDSVKSFAPIVQLLRGPFVLTVRSDLPIHNIGELAAYAKEHPGKLLYGSSGSGSLHHLCMEMLNSAAGIDMVHVPYSGSPPNWNALNRGEVDLICDSMPGPVPTLQGGRGRIIAVTGDQRLESAPNAGLFKEQGYPGVDIEFWYGLLAPAGTPKDIIEKLYAETNVVLRDPEILAFYKTQDIKVAPATPDEFGRMLVAEVKVWPPIIKSANVKLE